MTHPNEESVRPQGEEATEAAASAPSSEEPGDGATKVQPDGEASVAAGTEAQPAEGPTTDRAPAPTSATEVREATEAAGEDAQPAAAPAMGEAVASEGAAAADEATEPTNEAATGGDAETGEATGEAKEGAAAGDGSVAEPASETQQERLRAMQEIAAALESKSAVQGKVIGWNKGGFHVAVQDLPAFCPKSQIEIGNPKKSASYVGREMRFLVIEIRDDGKRVVLSRADLLKAEREKLLSETVVPNNVVEGKVTSITDFGAFVDLGGLEGLVHLSKLSRRRVDHPRDLLSVGDAVKVRVLKVEQGGDRISLSMKDLEPDPWQTARERYPVGSCCSGTIQRAADFGLFVEVEPGLEGLVHTSQLPLGKEMDDPGLAPGNEITCWIREVDGGRQRLSLSLREVAQNDPWEGLRSRYPEGKEVQGKVEQITKFGLFVELEPGLTGLLPHSVLGLPEGARAERTFSPGQTIAVQIDSVDHRRRRISLAPKGRRLEGTKADYKEYKQRQKGGESGSLNSMAAAFAKLQGGAEDRA